MITSVYQSLRLFCLMLFIILCSASAIAGTTGKISGKVTDDDNNEPIPGVNIVIQGTYWGTVTDVNGFYSLNNIPPGEYSVVFSSVGYNKVTVEQVLVKIDLTTKINAKLKSATLQLGKDVVITAERPLVQKDLTSTSSTITAGDIKMMPVESVNQIINLQAGVVGGHFRGGRSNEVAYLIDGVTVTDGFNGGMGLQVENAAIRQMEVISGTFNAEYGQAMSGVVNMVTQDGGDKMQFNMNGYAGNYFTTHSDIFKNLDNLSRVPQKDLQATVSGPTGLEHLYYFVTGRYAKDDGYLYGKRVFKVTDDVPIYPDSNNNSFWLPQNTGDNAWVSMNPSERMSLNAKLTYILPELKFSYAAYLEKNTNKYYDHYSSLTPDGIMNHYSANYMHNFQVTHYPSQSTFQTLKVSLSRYDYQGYLYGDPFDQRYVDPKRGIPTSSYTFRQGGNSGDRYHRYTRTLIAQWALSSQVSKEHKIGMGVEYRNHYIYDHGWGLVNLTEDLKDSVTKAKIFTPGYKILGTLGNQEIKAKPYEISAYLQDKLEYDIMIINAGIRLDYFNPNGKIPVNYKNLTDNSDFWGAGEFKNTGSTFQLSPRLGASFPITDQGIIRFSYGHFFQTPNFNNLYTNPGFLIDEGMSVKTILGNPELKPQKTIMYEIGLQQVLFNNLVLNLTGYYRDIRNLLGMEILKTYEGYVYARYINRDYGNVRGFIVTLDRRFSDIFSAKLDYTYQLAEGNASDPNTVFNNSQTEPKIEESKRTISLDWDQRHTINLSLNVGQFTDWTVGLIFQYGSGMPYTEDEKISRGVRFENGGAKPATFNLDLRADKTFDIAGVKVNTFLLIYNLLDIKNEYGVYATTGRANVDLGTKNAGEIIGVNTLEQYVNNPSMYSAPRQIRVGFGFGL